MTNIFNRSKKIIAYAQQKVLFQKLCDWLSFQKFTYRNRVWNNLQHTKKSVRHRLKVGVSMLLYTDDALSELIFFDEFEKSEQLFVNQYLDSGDTFVDIGANIGLFTLIAAKRVGKRGKVYSFEPISNTYKRLQENIAFNGFQNVKCFKKALSNQDAPGTMTTIPSKYSAWNSLAKPTINSPYTLEEVECVKWDTFASQNGLVGVISLMKIDVEGWEFHLLSGAKSVFSRHDAPDLLIEFSEENAESAGLTCAEVYHLLEELGYFMYTIDSNRKEMCLDPVRLRYEYVNLLATKSIDRVCKRTKFILRTQ